MASHDADDVWFQGARGIALLFGVSTEIVDGVGDTAPFCACCTDGPAVEAARGGVRDNDVPTEK